MVIGATIDYRDGFTGCMRALLLNGQLIDLKSYARRGLYGVSTDCVGRCDSSPCLNNGTCFERYDGYTCDCRWSAFKGPICADGEFVFWFGDFSNDFLSILKGIQLEMTENHFFFNTIDFFYQIFDE